MARTDIRAIDGLEAATEQAKALADAGADMIFPEALASLNEYAAMRKAIDVPILANVTEFGKNELFSARQLESVGVNLAIYQVSLLRLAMGIAETALDTLKAEGTLASLVPQMQTRARLPDLVCPPAARSRSAGGVPASAAGRRHAGHNASDPRRRSDPKPARRL